MPRSRRPPPTHRPEIERIVAGLVKDLPGVRPGKMFGFPAFYAGRKLFACIYGEGVGLKLPEQTVRALLLVPHIVPFQPYGKPPMREWVEIRRSKATDYRRDQELFRQAAELALTAQECGRCR